MSRPVDKAFSELGEWVNVVASHFSKEQLEAMQKFEELGEGAETSVFGMLAGAFMKRGITLEEFKLVIEGMWLHYKSAVEQ